MCSHPGMHVAGTHAAVMLQLKLQQTVPNIDGDGATVQCGADPEAIDFLGQTALMVAIFSGGGAEPAACQC